MLATLRLQHFRSYSDDAFEFSDGVNIIVGPNASGKTNLLEAVLLIARGKSYRANDQELIEFNAPWARLDSQMSDGSSRVVKLRGDTVPVKSFELSGKIFTRLSSAHSLPVVLFEPNHLSLVSGGPERRRDYLDDLLEQTIPGYGTVRRQYKRTLAQRNSLLKRADQGWRDQLFPWNIRLSELGAQLARARSVLVDQLQAGAPALYQELGGRGTSIGLVYHAQFPLESYETALLKKLETSTDLDRQRGFTASGPHREDLVIVHDGHPAQETASRGETRTLVLTLKILELTLLEAERKQPPLLLLDDVFSELDGARRRALTEHLSSYQTFITTTDADIVTHHFTDTCLIIPVSKAA